MHCKRAGDTKVFASRLHEGSSRQQRLSRHDELIFVVTTVSDTAGSTGLVLKLLNSEYCHEFRSIEWNYLFKSKERKPYKMHSTRCKKVFEVIGSALPCLIMLLVRQVLDSVLRIEFLCLHKSRSGIGWNNTLFVILKRKYFLGHRWSYTNGIN